MKRYNETNVSNMTDEEREMIEAIMMHAAYLGLTYSEKPPKKLLYYMRLRMEEGWSLSDFYAVLMGAYRLKEKGLLDVQGEKMGLGDFFTPKNVSRFLSEYYKEIDGNAEMYEPDESPERSPSAVRERHEKDFETEKNLVKLLRGIKG